MAESTAAQIANAEMAEIRVLASSLVIHLVPRATGTSGQLLLEVAEDEPKGVCACYPDYARLRILSVVEAMGMEVEGIPN